MQFKLNLKKVIVILVIIAAAVISYQISQSKSQTLPQLYVDGAFIKRKDTQEKVLLKGVSSHTYVSNKDDPFSETKKFLESELFDWQINLLNVHYDAKEILKPNTNSDLDILVDYASQRGLYILLSPTMIDSKELPLPDDYVINALDLLTSRYKSKKNILYSLYNQPADVSWEEWFSLAVSLSQVVRNNNPDAIIVLSGTKWSRDLRYLKEKQFPFANVVYNIHDYLWPGEDTRLWWSFLIGKAPIIFGAFGGFYTDVSDICPYQSVCDLDYIKASLSTVDTNINQIHYSFDSMSDLISEGQMTEYGKLIYNNITNLPPTKFINNKNIKPSQESRGTNLG